MKQRQFNIWRVLAVTLIVVVIAAAEATVGLAIVLLIYRNWRGIGSDHYSVMKW